jgi:hypothetical protein
MFIYDKTQDRCVHYANEPNTDFLDLFNKQSHREFYTNKDYINVGGRKNDFDYSSNEEEADSCDDQE